MVTEIDLKSLKSRIEYFQMNIKQYNERIIECSKSLLEIAQKEEKSATDWKEIIRMRLILEHKESYELFVDTLTSLEKSLIRDNAKRE